jgi:hypothetical protein
VADVANRRICPGGDEPRRALKSALVSQQANDK